MNLILIALLEGFVTLAVEIIAIRLSIPIVGSSMILTGVMLGVILLSLSAGYWSAGKLSAQLQPESIPRALMQNFLKAGLFYLLVTFPLHGMVMEGMLAATQNMIVAILVTSLLYVYPVWVASQTIPLLTQLDKAQTAGEKSGKMLFFSTLGSMAGSTLTPILLFPALGVYNSALAMVLVLVVCAAMTRQKTTPIQDHLATATVFTLVLVLGYSHHTDAQRFETPYQTLIIEDTDNTRSLRSGNVYASQLLLPGKEPGLEYAMEGARLLQDDQKLLVIGSAGFTVPQHLAKDPSKDITAIDVDPDVRRIAEQHFLKEPLKPNIKFEAVGGRYFVRNTQEHFDHVMVDAYFSLNIPLELATVEFFEELSKITRKVSMNIIADRDMKTPYAQRMLTTFKKVFPEAHYRDVTGRVVTNLMLTSHPREGYQLVPDFDVVPYTDDNSNADHEILALSDMIWREN